MTRVHPRIAVSGISALKWSFAQDVAFAVEQGVSAVGILGPKAIDDPAGTAALLQEARIAASCVTASTSGGIMIADEPEDAARLLEALRPSIALARTVGGAPCYFTSGPAPEHMPTDTAFDALVAAAGPVVDHARAQGVRLALEHNNTATRHNGFVHTLRDGIDLAEATGLDICLEIQNCWTERKLPEMIRQNVGRFAVAQVSDYRTGETTQLNRRPLGDGSIPLEWLLGLLLDAGFSGYFEIETLGPAVEAEGYAPAIRRSIEWLDERLTRWGV